MTSHDFWYCIGDIEGIPKLYVLLGVITALAFMLYNSPKTYNDWEERIDIPSYILNVLFSAVVGCIWPLFWFVVILYFPYRCFTLFIIKK